MAEILLVEFGSDAVLLKNVLAHGIKHLPLIRAHLLGLVLANFVHSPHESRFLRECLKLCFLLRVVDHRMIADAFPGVLQFGAAEIDE